jgi:hypothetical protein
MAGEGDVMNLIFPFAIIFLFGWSVWYIISPLFDGTNTIPVQISRDELERKKIVLMRQVKELEMDHHIGNLSDEDFESGRNSLKNEISGIMAELRNKS